LFESLGTTIFRRRRAVLVVSGLFLALAIVLLVRGGPLSSGAIRGLEAERAQRIVDEMQGRRSETTFAVVFAARGLPLDPPQVKREVARALAPLRSDPRVMGVVSPLESPDFTPQRRLTGGPALAIAFVTLRGEFDQALLAYPDLRSRLVSDTLDIACTGQLPFMHDLNRTLEHDLMRAELVSLPIALLVLLFVFRTVVASALPVGVGALAVVGGIAIVLGLAHHIDIAQYSINVCSLIGLGLAIDYSLFIVSRYREELGLGHDYAEALRRSLASAGRMVAFSGLAVGTGLSGLLFFRGSYLFAMGVGGAIVVGLSVVFALTFLPALLAVLGSRVHAGKLPGLRVAPRTNRWHGLALFVMKRPLVILVPTLVLLIAIGSPFRHLRLATADVRVLPQSAEARRGFERLRASFPELAATRIPVAVEFPSAPLLNAERLTALRDLARKIAALPGVSRVENVLDSAAATARGRSLPPAASNQRTALLLALTAEPPESEEARRIVRRIRSLGPVADGGVLVAGQTAADLDATAYILSRTPYAVGVVVGVTVLVLFLLLHSVVLPIKAVLMNFLSIAGSFGALVWVFQDGNGFISEPRPLEPALPVLLFCILFGLSMDYEVLMLSRMKECYARTGDNTLAVAEGLEKSAGLITSAAAIMVVVFSAFAFARVVLIQAVGFGMALAVLLDATVVRILLVPATMRLFGDLNWWAPRLLLGHSRDEHGPTRHARAPVSARPETQ
jgi:putative drug exporter of the RND superfamily